MPGIELIRQLEEHQILQLHDLYSRQWWTSERTLADIRTMLSSSDMLFAYWDRHADKLVAFARVLTDHVYRAMIFDVIVDEQLRGFGVGKQLMNDILKETAHIERVELYCKEDKVPFYEKLGFTILPTTHLMRREL
jgi:predicted GNAT family N-acyltransferase